MIDAVSTLLFTFMVNYFIHSSLFILTVLLAIQLKAISFDRLGEWLMKSTLVLGFMTAIIQTGGWLNDINAGISDTGFWTFQLVQKDDIKGPPVTSSGTGVDSSNQTTIPEILLPAISGQSQQTPSILNSSKNKLQKNSVDTVSKWLLLWFVAVILLMFRYQLRKRQLNTLLFSREAVTNSEINCLFQQMLVAAKLSRPIKLSQCTALSSPIALHNEVVLPTEFIRLQQLVNIKAALAHELAHIKRRDPIWMKISQGLEVLSFFQPLNNLLNQQIHQLAEQRADSLAAKWTQNPKALAATLAACIIDKTEHLSPHNPTQMVPAMSSKKSNLLLRIENLMSPKSPRTGRYLPAVLITLMFVVLMMSPGVIAKIAAADSNGQSNSHSSRHIEIDGGITDMSVSYSNDDRSMKLKAKLKGELLFNSDETDIIAFPANSKFDLTVDDGDIEKRLVIKSSRGSGQNAPTYTYYEDGDKLAYDQAARNWFAQVIPEVLRSTGLDAKARVRRIQSNFGDDAVLDEIELIQSDWVKKTYFTHLFKLSELNGGDLQRAMQLTTDISSDFELSHVLNALVDTQAVTSESQWLQLLSSTGSIQSDFEQAKTLMEFQKQLPQSAEINQAYFTAATSIQSDFEMSKVLINYVEQQKPNSVNLLHLFELASEIQSDFELAKLLLALNNQMNQASEDVFAGYLSLAEDIQSDFEMKKVYSNLLKYDLSTGNLTQMIESAGEQISSDFELSALLTEVLQQGQVNATIRELIKNVSNNSISSRFERERVLTALL